MGYNNDAYAYNNSGSEDVDQTRVSRAASLANALPLDILRSRSHSIDIEFENAIGAQGGSETGLPSMFFDSLRSSSRGSGYGYNANNNSNNNSSPATPPTASTTPKPAPAPTPAMPAARSSVGLSMQIYQDEKNDRLHRMGNLLDDVQKYHSKYKIVEPFDKWINSMDYFTAFLVLDKINRELPKGKQSSSWQVSNEASAFIKGVEYLSVQSRGSYAIEVRKGLIYWKDEPLDTTKLETHFSGMGWAMWIQSPDDSFYTNSHVKGRFHHSSFLSGDNVLGAGEWEVKAGRLTMITGKSGHYQPQMSEFYRSLMTLQAMGVPLRDTDVVVYEISTGNPVVMPASMAMDNWPSLCSQYKSWGTKTVRPKVSRPRQPLMGNHRVRSHLIG